LAPPARADEPKAGPSPALEIEVDATEAPRKLYHARLVLPARPGKLTLYYPKWIPGEHAPTGPITDLAGLKFRAGEQALPWQRGTALPIVSQNGTRTAFAPVSLETLVDSPVVCGAHLRDVPLGPAGDPPHVLTLACDSPAALDLSPAMKANYDRLVAEAGAL